MTMISNGRWVCASALSIASSRYRVSLYTGMITLTVGSPVASSDPVGWTSSRSRHLGRLTPSSPAARRRSSERFMMRVRSNCSGRIPRVMFEPWMR